MADKKIKRKKLKNKINIVQKKNTIVKKQSCQGKKVYQCKKICQSDELKKIKPKLVRILKRNGIKKAGIFGSYARGDHNKNSDLDVLVMPTKGMGFAFFGLQIELEEKLGRKVDLVSYKAIRQELKNRILKEEVRII